MTVADDLAPLREMEKNGRQTLALDRVEAEIARLTDEVESWKGDAEYAVRQMQLRREQAEAAEAEAARLRDGLRALVTLVRIGFLVSVNGERATAETVNDPAARQVLFAILQAKDSDEAAHALLDEDGAATCKCPSRSYNPGAVHEPYCPLAEDGAA